MKTKRVECPHTTFRFTEELRTILMYKALKNGVSRNAFMQQYLWNQWGNEYDDAIKWLNTHEYLSTAQLTN